MTNGPQLPLVRELAAMLERALNREIAASTPATDLVADLDGESFAIDVRGVGARCVLRAVGGRVAVEPSLAAPSGADSTQSPASATLSATPIDLLRLARAADLSTLRGTGAEIKGSPEVAERFA
jgi:hypothetical protein